MTPAQDEEAEAVARGLSAAAVAVISSIAKFGALPYGDAVYDRLHSDAIISVAPLTHFATLTDFGHRVAAVLRGKQ